MEDEMHLTGNDFSVDSASPEEVDIDTYKPTILPDRRLECSALEAVLPPTIPSRQALRDGKTIYSSSTPTTSLKGDTL